MVLNQSTLCQQHLYSPQLTQIWNERECELLWVWDDGLLLSAYTETSLVTFTVFIATALLLYDREDWNCIGNIPFAVWYGYTGHYIIVCISKVSCSELICVEWPLMLICGSSQDGHKSTLKFIRLSDTRWSAFMVLGGHESPAIMRYQSVQCRRLFCSSRSELIQLTISRWLDLSSY